MTPPEPQPTPEFEPKRKRKHKRKSKPEPAPAAKPQQSTLTSVAGMIGAAGGWALSKYTGASLFIPLFASLALFFVFTKTSFSPARFKGAIAMTAGQVAWFVVASVVVGVWSATIVDVVLLSAGLLALWLRPGLLPALYLGLVQAVSLAINAFHLTSVAIGSAEHRALTVHCVVRLLVLGALVVGYRQLQREPVATPAS